MVRKDSDYFHQRAAEARAAASNRGRDEEAAIAGELALAYAALARRRAAADAESVICPVPAPESSETIIPAVPVPELG